MIRYLVAGVMLASATLAGCSGDVPVEAQVAGACNTYGNVGGRLEAYKSVIPTDALIGLSETNKRAKATCEAARDGVFTDGPAAALFVVTQANDSFLAVICAINPGETGCPIF